MTSWTRLLTHSIRRGTGRCRVCAPPSDPEDPVDTWRPELRRPPPRDSPST